MAWDIVVLNLPGDKHYDPELPWVYRYNTVTGQMANFFGTYIDDIRTGGPEDRRKLTVMDHQGALLLSSTIWECKMLLERDDLELLNLEHGQALSALPC